MHSLKNVKPMKVISEHVMTAVVVVIANYFLGRMIRMMFI